MLFNLHTDLYAFPPFSVIGHLLQKIQKDGGDVLAIQPRLLQLYTSPGGLRFSAQTPPPYGSTTSSSTSPSFLAKNSSDPFLLIRRSLKTEHFRTVCQHILQAWRQSTKLQYGSYLKKWLSFCAKGRWMLCPHLQIQSRFLDLLVQCRSGL